MSNGFEYTYIGHANVKKALTLVLLSIGSGLLFGIMSVGDSVFVPYLRGASGIFLFLGALLAVRFIGTRYSYKILVSRVGDGDLEIDELRGYFGKTNTVKVRRTLCRVSLLDICAVDTFKCGKKDRKRMRSIKRSARKESAAFYNYSADVFPENFAVIKISESDGVSYIKFSPDAALLDIIKR